MAGPGPALLQDQWLLLGAGVAALLLLLGVGLLLVHVRLGRMRAHDREARLQLQRQLAELSGQIRQQADVASARDAHIARLLGERLDALALNLGQSLQEQSARTGRHLQDLSARLALVEEARAAIRQLASDVADLQRILADKQARGAFGQARMEAIVADALPAGLYDFQTTLPNGARPDCTIRMPDGETLLVIDAKFPLEGFEDLRQATDAEGRRRALRRFRKDVMRHVAAMAEKYLIPGVTHDMAILFVPSESVYAAVHEEMPEVVQAAHARRIVLASPNTLMLMVQTLQGLLRHVRLQEAADIIDREVRIIVSTIDSLLEQAGLLGRHLDKARQALDRVEDAARHLERHGRRLERLDPDGEPGRPAPVSSSAENAQDQPS